MSLLRKRMMKQQETESPYAFSFNIVPTGNSPSYQANIKDLAILNKGLAIIVELAGGNLDGFEFTSDNAPQEFDLRISGVRYFSFYFSNFKDGIDVFLGFFDGVNWYFGQTTISASNPRFKSFTLYNAL